MPQPLNIIDTLRLQMPPAPCSYLPEERASLVYRLIEAPGSADYAGLLQRGWRRHGNRFFRPGCPNCTKCISLRVLVNQFSPSKSQRRNLRRNADVRLVVQRPTVSSAHIELFNAYHADMAERRGWPAEPVIADEYHEAFLNGRYSFEREFLYYRDDELIGVGLVDEVPDALSSVYFYHAPHWRSGGPGTFSILQEIDFARRTGRDHVYLGYWIRENASMRYKSGFRPHEILREPVPDDGCPEWSVPPADSGA